MCIRDSVQTCLQMIAIMTPIVAFGAWLIARIPHERLSKSKGYAWEAYFGFPIVAGSFAAALTVMGYFCIRLVDEVKARREWSALGYVLGIGGVAIYMWIITKLMGAFETRGAKIHYERKKKRQKKQKEKIQKMDFPLKDIIQDEEDEDLKEK